MLILCSVCFSLLPLQDILSGGITIDFSFKLSELQQFQNRAANYQLASIKGGNEAKNKPMPLIRFRKGAESKMMLSWQ